MNQFEKFHKEILKKISNKERISPLKAIRAFCLECCGYNSEEVSECVARPGESCACPLYAYRTGKNTTGGGKNRGVKASD